MTVERDGTKRGPRPLSREAPRERKVRRVKPETRAHVVDAVERVAAKLAGGEPLALLLAVRLEAVAGEAERERQVVDAMLPPVDVLADAATTQLLWNAKARRDAIAETAPLTAAQIAEIRGIETPNPHPTITRWVKERRVFAIDSPRGRLVPAFQLDEGGEPRPVVGRVLGALRGQLRDLELLLWWTGSSGFLNGARPLDYLAKDPEAVVAAAAYQASLSED